MFDWKSKTTYRDEVLVSRPNSDEVEPEAIADLPQSSGSATGRIVLVIGFFVSTAVLPQIISESSYAAPRADGVAVAQVVHDARSGDNFFEMVRPEEAWLFRNQEALSSVQRGLGQAAARDFVAPPDLDALWAQYEISTD